MAIFHASTKPLSRSSGRSAVAASAYRAGEKLIDERTGLSHDYTRKGGVAGSEIVLADGTSVERNALWNAAEAAEKRKDARTAREWVIALPAELDDHQRRMLAREFGVQLAQRYGVAVDIAIHRPDREGDNRNHHAHVLTTTRKVSRGQDGRVELGEKATIELSDTKRRGMGLGSAADEVTAVRQIWERLANHHLERTGHDARIDARSLKAQGVDREPTTHLGPTVTEMERRGIQTDRGDGNRQAVEGNQARERLTAQVIELDAARRQRAAQATAMTPEQSVAAWQEEKTALATAYRRQGQALENRIAGRVDQIERNRQQQRVTHEREQPEQPRGLLGMLKQGAYDKAMAVWTATADRIEAWMVSRQEQLQRRMQVVRDYLNDPRKADAKADSRLRRDRSEWGARINGDMEAVRRQRIEQQRAEERARKQRAAEARAVKEFTRIAANRRLNVGGYTDRSDDWKATPEGLRKTIDAFNKAIPAQQKALLDTFQTSQKARDGLVKMIVDRDQAIGKGISR